MCDFGTCNKNPANIFNNRNFHKFNNRNTRKNVKCVQKCEHISYLFLVLLLLNLNKQMFAGKLLNVTSYAAALNKFPVITH